MLSTQPKGNSGKSVEVASQQYLPPGDRNPWQEGSGQSRSTCQPVFLPSETKLKEWGLAGAGDGSPQRRREGAWGDKPPTSGNPMLTSFSLDGVPTL